MQDPSPPHPALPPSPKLLPRRAQRRTRTAGSASPGHDDSDDDAGAAQDREIAELKDLLKESKKMLSTANKTIRETVPALKTSLAAASKHQGSALEYKQLLTGANTELAALRASYKVLSRASPPATSKAPVQGDRQKGVVVGPGIESRGQNEGGGRERESKRELYRDRSVGVSEREVNRYGCMDLLILSEHRQRKRLRRELLQTDLDQEAVEGKYMQLLYRSGHF